MAAWSVSVQISSLKHVPPDFLDKLGTRREDICLRVQGALDGASRETGASRWGRGARAGEAFWAGDTGSLEWRFDSEEALRKAEKKTPLLKLYVKGDVSLETMVVIDICLGFTQMWDKKLKDPLWEFLSLKIRKYKPFLNIDVFKYKTILREVINV